MDFIDTAINLWHGLGWPLARLIFFISLGVLIGNFIESLNWTHAVARLTTPLIRLGRLSDTAGASFTVAFFSGVTANTMLAEAYEQKRINKQELIFANLFNSLPTYFLHLPTLFFIAAPLIKGSAFVYVGLTMFAAFLRTLLIILLGRAMLATKAETCISCKLEEEKVADWRIAVDKAWQRFRVRIKKILVFTMPIYVGIFILSRMGVFTRMEGAMAQHLSFLAWLHPQSISIVALQLSADLSVGLAAAGALLDGGSLGSRDIVLALLVGNIFSSPMRAIRHQFPFYSGIFRPALATELILYNQSFRMGSIILVSWLYYLITV